MQMQDRVGQQLGNYRLTRLIGKGGYAEVYLAEHVYLNNMRYAIKVLTGTNLQDYQREEFRIEAHTLASLQSLNSHIVQVLDFGILADEHGRKDHDIPYLVMEYAAEGTLRSVYPQGTEVPLNRIIFYVNQIAEALQCVHSQMPPIVHRDIKPENMLLRTRDHVLLSDFGIAITGQTGLLAKPQGGGVVGTATYMAPERLSGHTRRAGDQYSLGIVVYEWLCGEPPFDGTEMEICYKQISAPPPVLHQVYPHVTKEIEAVVMRALQKKPEDRYPTVEAFAQELEQAIQPTLKPQGNMQQVGNVVHWALPPAQQLTVPPTLPPVSLQSTQSQPSLPSIPQQAQAQRVQTQPLSPNPRRKQTQPLPVAPQQPLPSPSQQVQPLSLPPSPRPQVQPQQVQPLSLPPSPRPAQLQQVLSPSPPQVQPLLFAPSPRQVQLQRGNSDTTVVSPSPAQQLVIPTRPVLSSTRKLSSRNTQSFFEFSSLFARDRRYRLFRSSGYLLDILSSILIGLLLHNIYLFLAGLFFSCLLFALCIRAVEEKLAFLFGGLLALYWGAVGWETGSVVAASFALQKSIFSFVVGLVFFIGSLALHIWYISRKSS